MQLPVWWTPLMSVSFILSFTLCHPHLTRDDARGKDHIESHSSRSNRVSYWMQPHASQLACLRDNFRVWPPKKDREYGRGRQVACARKAGVSKGWRHEVTRIMVLPSGESLASIGQQLHVWAMMHSCFWKYEGKRKLSPFPNPKKWWCYSHRLKKWTSSFIQWCHEKGFQPMGLNISLFSVLNSDFWLQFR